MTTFTATVITWQNGDLSVSGMVDGVEQCRWAIPRKNVELAQRMCRCVEAGKALVKFNGQSIQLPNGTYLTWAAAFASVTNKHLTEMGF